MVNTERLCMGCMNDNGGEQVCPICGFDNSGDNPKEYLKIGTWLNANRYFVGKVIEESGDGVTYIGWDNDANAVVNVKEYFRPWRKLILARTVKRRKNDIRTYRRAFAAQLFKRDTRALRGL